MATRATATTKRGRGRPAGVKIAQFMLRLSDEQAVRLAELAERWVTPSALLLRWIARDLAGGWAPKVGQASDVGPRVGAGLTADERQGLEEAAKARGVSAVELLRAGIDEAVAGRWIPSQFAHRPRK